MTHSSYPLVSVIIPVYNREDFIVQAMESVLSENYPNKELVIIDDGSSDQSATLIQEWAKRNEDRIQVTFKSRENKGVVPTMNELVAMSHGEFIVFFGSDDRLENNGILKRYEYLKSNPDKLMVIGDAHLIDGKNNRLHESAYISIGRVNKDDLKTDAGMRKFMILNGYVPGATLMADKRIYDPSELGPYEERFHTEDWVYYIRATITNRIGFLDEVVASYRVHDHNMCFSPVQIGLAKEQLQLSFEIFTKFRGLDLLYMTKRVLFLFMYIPYLSLKFKLMGQQQDPSAANYRPPFVLKVLLSVKNGFLHLFGREFARQ